MLNRRTLLTFSLAGGALFAAAGLPPAARAQSAEQATAFITQTGKELAAVINGGGSKTEKAQRLQQIVDRTVDVDSVARFCLGRFWRVATPEQQKQYLQLFHQVLLRSITGKIGDFEGVAFTVGRTTPQDGGVSVATVVTRPGSAPANVDWVVSAKSGTPRIVDVVAEGTSLRLTQRSDYASYLSRNSDNIAALLAAMRQQLSQPS